MSREVFVRFRGASFGLAVAWVFSACVGCSTQEPPPPPTGNGGTTSSASGGAGGSNAGTGGTNASGGVTGAGGSGGSSSGSGGSSSASGGTTGTPDAAPDTTSSDVGGNVPDVGGGDTGGPTTLNPAVVAQMRKVADWQLPRVGTSKDWIRGAMWTGIFATYQSTKDEKYLTAIKTWAGAGWGLSGGAGARGDNQCAAQTFFDVYLLDPKPENMAMLNSKSSFDAMLNENRSGRVEWWWEDALFMVPPGFVRLAAATKDPRYITKMNTLFWDTYAYLWNDGAGLMYRDNGLRGNFWARGNGWVIAGAVRVLQYLPQNDPKRPDYIKLVQRMAQALKNVQGSDGLWRANLLNPNAIPNPETSGTGFFTYAMAWGINNGILDRATYLPVVQKGWMGLNTHVDASGKLGYVQPVGAGPAPAGAGSTVEYGVGAYLLAGSEVAKLAP